jgi:DnaK suppressor protein
MKQDKSKKRVSPYNDEELDFFREIIFNKRKETEKELEAFQNVLGDYLKNPSGESADSAGSSDTADSDSQPHGKEEKYKQYIRRRDYLRELNHALDRIEKKTFGICKVTGKYISKQRLEEVPHTQLSLEAEEKS